MIKVLIFDFDGVIINEYQKDYEAYLNIYPDLTHEHYKDLFEGNFRSKADTLLGEGNSGNAEKEYGLHVSTVKIKESVKSILRNFSKDYTIGVISSAVEKTLNDCIDNNDFKGFSFIYGFETNRLKTEKFKMVFEKFNVKPEECLYITDTAGDVREARKVGVKSIALDCGYHERWRLEKAKPMKIISSFEELPSSLP
ncbi:HAD family hydrolase [archaeon]|nr:HAD family hydrolase [archaeon]MBL7057618.1 HAD family hydrolase [Candidatus Woesearchaeota archaeon]